jgi:S-adenosylmethionine:diacylglycerol 3-amino-3-carboxypropyl transferase
MGFDMKRSLWTTVAGWSLPEHTGISDDLNLLIHALAPARGSKFICISSHGSGEAALALAAGGASMVTAYDIGDAQMLGRLITLKSSAARVLNRAEYLSLIGLAPATRSRKRDIVTKTINALPDPDRRYWAERRRWFTPGLFFASRQTFFLQMLWTLIWLLTPIQERQEMLFSGSPDTRVRMFRRYVSRPWLKRVWGKLGSRINLFYPQAEWRSSDYPKVFNRDPFPYFEHLVASGLPCNPLFAHCFLDRDQSLPEQLLPPHLRSPAFDELKKAKDRMQVVQSAPGDIPFLSLASHSCHGAYLSNIIDYLGHDDRQRLLQEVSRVLVAGAPALIYSSEQYDKVPPGCGLVRDEEACSRLAAQDQVRIYSRVGLFRAIQGAASKTAA